MGSPISPAADSNLVVDGIPGEVEWAPGKYDHGERQRAGRSLAMEYASYESNLIPGWALNEREDCRCCVFALVGGCWTNQMGGCSGKQVTADLSVSLHRPMNFG